MATLTKEQIKQYIKHDILTKLYVDNPQDEQDIELNKKVVQAYEKDFGGFSSGHSPTPLMVASGPGEGRLATFEEVAKSVCQEVGLNFSSKPSNDKADFSFLVQQLDNEVDPTSSFVELKEKAKNCPHGIVVYDILDNPSNLATNCIIDIFYEEKMSHLNVGMTVDKTQLKSLHHMLFSKFEGLEIPSPQAVPQDILSRTQQIRAESMSNIKEANTLKK